MKTLVIEGGGSGYRAAEVEGQSIRIIAVKTAESLKGPRDLLEFIRAQAQACGAKAVGVSISGFVADDGSIEHSTNTGLPPNFPLAGLISEVTGLRARVVNDLVAATRGASLIFPDLKRFAVENLGGGDGQNEYDNGRIKPIDERGHMTIDLSPFALPCSCGLYGCAETILGGKSLTRLVRFTIEAKRLDLPKEMGPLAFLDEEYRRGSIWASRLYGQFCLALGVKLAAIQLGGKFPAFVFRGTTITKALALPGIEHLIRNSLRERLPAKSWADAEFRVIPLHPKGIKDYDAFLGAAEFAQEG